jgi:hypothetical protein
MRERIILCMYNVPPHDEGLSIWLLNGTKF